MAAKTTVKVATLTGAAKDDFLAAAATGLTQEKLSANLDVLGNDPGSAKIYSLVQNAAAIPNLTTQFPVKTSVELASGATISINADGTIAYNASAIKDFLQTFGAGEVFADTFEYTIRMANGALSTAKATVEIAGLNDAPTLTSVDPVCIHDTAAADANVFAESKVLGIDIDRNDILHYSLRDGSQESTNEYGKLIVNSEGEYKFVVDTDKLDSMNAGAEATTSFEVTVTDQHGAASAPVTLTFKLIGANDTASIDGQATGIVSEDGAPSAAGHLTVTDRDSGESVFQAPTSLLGKYGDFTFNTGTGEWTYLLRNGDANVQALKSSQEEFDTLIVKSLDGSATETIQVTIKGLDEAPATPPQTENTVQRYLINHGLNDQNQPKHSTIDNFDSNDILAFAGNYGLVGFNVVDYLNDGIWDTVVTFASKTDGNGNGNGNGNGSGNASVIEVFLIGFTGLKAEQIVHA